LRMKDDSIIVLEPGQPESDQERPQIWRQRLYRRQLHRELMLMHCPTFQEEPGGMDIDHDLPGCVRRWRQKHDRAGEADGALSNAAKPLLDNPASTALEYDALITAELRSGRLPTEIFGAPLRRA